MVPWRNETGISQELKTTLMCNILMLFLKRENSYPMSDVSERFTSIINPESAISGRAASPPLRLPVW